MRDMDVDEPIRTLVIAAASRHGGTDEMADRLASTLRGELAAPWTVERTDPSDLGSLDAADAVVLGSAIYMGQWLRPALHALNFLEGTAPRGLWLFSTGPVSDEESDNARVISADSMVEAGLATEHRVFGGRLDRSRLNMAERVVVALVRAKPGDHRDWEQVDAWAHHIAQQLSSTPSATKDQ
ncbi:hypothetical protein BH09ACT10_BH09ACT10_04170 [soil metagenome]